MKKQASKKKGRVSIDLEKSLRTLGGFDADKMIMEKMALNLLFNNENTMVEVHVPVTMEELALLVQLLVEKRTLH